MEEVEKKCPICGARCVKRQSKYGEFWGCSLYKDTGCKGIWRPPKPLTFEPLVGELREIWYDLEKIQGRIQKLANSFQEKLDEN